MNIDEKIRLVEEYIFRKTGKRVPIQLNAANPVVEMTLLNIAYTVAVRDSETWKNKGDGEGS